jgi:hypothetical protein
MNHKKNALIVFLFSIFLTAIFHKQAFGLNLFLAEIILFVWLFFSKQFTFKGANSLLMGVLFIVSSFATVITHSLFSYVFNFILLFIFIGIIIYPETKSFFNSILFATLNLYYSQMKFFGNLFSMHPKGKNSSGFFKIFLIFSIPVLVIFLFILIYRLSNPVFDKLINDSWSYLADKFNLIFKNFDFWIIITFMICLFISVFVFVRHANKHLKKRNKKAKESLIRDRSKSNKKIHLGFLINEHKAGVFLFIILNLVLLVLNIIDVKWVWIDFHWNGQYLKQFVHEGTYLLVFSIILSMSLVLYFFRGKLSFYPKNNLLKYLSYAWLIQNGILIISVAIRNFWYINYYALAYKRIGVIIFLILTIYGLFSVYTKVRFRKSAFYLIKTNVTVWLIILTISSVINWDIIIAKYNFKHAQQSFIHLDYLVTLSDKSLPYMDQPIDELQQINGLQKIMFPSGIIYMSPENYHMVINYRKQKFIKEWETKGFLSWNWPEYVAYKKLKKEATDHP